MLNLNPADHDYLEDLLLELRARTAESGHINKIFGNISEYPKHAEFFRAGAKFKHRLFRAANRVGKTTGAAYEVACHLTGDYPDWWDGLRRDSPLQLWICGETKELVRQSIQGMLLGPNGEFGTGLIAKDKLDFDTLKDAQKADTGIASFRVKHKSGGYSLVEFKSYDQGRTAFQATERSIWFDEEPPLAVYTEALLRTMTGDNFSIMTFTPLKGASEVIMLYTKDGDVLSDGEISSDKYVITASWDDVPHLSQTDKEALLKTIPPYQRDARSKGIPSLGSGAIYAIPESEIKIPAFQIPNHFKRAFGMDVGWNRTAAIWFATDPDTGIHYGYSEHYVSEAQPATHAMSIQSRGAWIPGVIDPASRGRTQDEGRKLFEIYEERGLKLQAASNEREGPLWEILEAMYAGQIKIFDTLTNFWKEFRSYSRDEKGQIIKKNDHLCDSMRYWWNSGRQLAISELELKVKSKISGLPTTRIKL